MAKYVYVVVKKQFFNENGIDYALPIGIGNINTFSTMKKAEEYVEEFVHIMDKVEEEPKFEIFNDNPANTFSDIFCKACKVYAQQTYNQLGVRTGFMILKEVVY